MGWETRNQQPTLDYRWDGKHGTSNHSTGLQMGWETWDQQPQHWTTDGMGNKGPATTALDYRWNGKQGTSNQHWTTDGMGNKGPATSTGLQMGWETRDQQTAMGWETRDQQPALDLQGSSILTVDMTSYGSRLCLDHREHMGLLDCFDQGSGSTDMLTELKGATHLMEQCYTCIPAQKTLCVFFQEKVKVPQTKQNDGIAASTGVQLLLHLSYSLLQTTQHTTTHTHTFLHIPSLSELSYHENSQEKHCTENGTSDSQSSDCTEMKHTMPTQTRNPPMGEHQNQNNML